MTLPPRFWKRAFGWLLLVAAAIVAAYLSWPTSKAESLFVFAIVVFLVLCARCRR